MTVAHLSKRSLSEYHEEVKVCGLDALLSLHVVRSERVLVLLLGHGQSATAAAVLRLALQRKRSKYKIRNEGKDGRTPLPSITLTTKRVPDYTHVRHGHVGLGICRCDN